MFLAALLIHKGQRICDGGDPLQGHVTTMFCIFVFLYLEAIPLPVTAEQGMLLPKNK